MQREAEHGIKKLSLFIRGSNTPTCACPDADYELRTSHPTGMLNTDRFYYESDI